MLKASFLSSNPVPTLRSQQETQTNHHWLCIITSTAMSLQRQHQEEEQSQQQVASFIPPTHGSNEEELCTSELANWIEENHRQLELNGRTSVEQANPRNGGDL
eukprot:scaffold1858_cov101-Cylindrotheca_fusiformis.AAC.3